MGKNSMVAMILAGGRGSRLYDLTKKVAKPAVGFGGKYRIIDFPLSNCANSGVTTVGVLTQYESVALNAYVARDHHWGLDARDSGVFVLPPREKDEKGFSLYRGTADAITQNIDFLDEMDAEYVLILSGDHIYKMNYDAMLKQHQLKQADATIAVLPVPIKEASRFGIMNTNKDGIIEEFEEKPENPKSNLASMGIYIFNYKELRKYLAKDESNKDSHHDFGKDIIPAYLKDHKKLLAYRFNGYWKDVGTIDSLWEANMDLLKNDDLLNLSDSTWKIYTEDINVLPQYLGEKSKINQAYVTQGCVIEGEVDHSVLFTNAVVKENAQVKDSVIMNNAVIDQGAIVNRCIVASDVVIGKGVVVGDPESDKITLIAKSIKKAGGR